jgi:fatty-acyl-CoA synthase
MTGSYWHVGGARPLSGLSIDAAFSQVVEKFPNRDAVVSLPQKKRLSYRELEAEVSKLARGLLAAGVNVGKRVGIWSTNNIQWLVLQLATARVGAVLVNINPAYRVGELEHALRLARVQELFVIPSFRSSDYLAMIRELGPDRLPELRHIVVFDPQNPSGTATLGEPFSVWPDFLAGGDGISETEVERVASGLDPDDAINIQFTSGTTGFPKAVVLSHHNILNNGLGCGRAMAFSERDRLAVPVPFYHCFGMVVSNLAALTHGACIVIPAEHFDPEATLDAVEQEKCTALHGVPTMFIAELEAQSKKARDLSSLRTGIMAGAPCPPDLMTRVMDEMGITEILIAYGQTEASPVTHCTHVNDSFERRIGTVGTNLAHQEVKVVDVDTGAQVPMGAQGEVCFRGHHVMKGYFEQPDKTREAIDENGWLHSGDLGVMDEDGYLKITGRIKEMIIRGGENIYPAEIEAFYFKESAIAEIAVFGIPDEKLGEEVAAFVRLAPGVSLDEEGIRELGRGKIAHFKVPRHIWVVEEFPTTVTGKIQKFRMRDMAERYLRHSNGKDKP